MMFPADIFHGPLTLGLSYLFKSALMFAVVMTFAARAARTGHPFDRFGAANYLTTFRAGVVSLVGGLVGEVPTPAIATGAALVTFVVAALDGVDGPLARRSGMASAFGARFDMEVDALLVMVLSVLVWQHGKAGVWIVAAGLMRYAFVAAGWMWPWLTRPLFPSMRRKTICVVLVVGLSALLLPLFAPPASVYIAAALLALLTYSFLADTVWLVRHVD